MEGSVIMKPDMSKRVPNDNSVVGRQANTATKLLQHIDDMEATLWVLIAILLLAAIAAGFMFWLIVG